MSAPSLNTRLTSMDSTFLYFEKKEAPMHIGSVSIFEGEIPFDKFMENIRSKMHLLPRYQQKVVPDPFNLGHPTWEFDSNFDINNHVFRTRIDAPGSEEELIKLAGRIFGPMMDRKKPLWDIYLVYGLEGKRTAMIARVHHCMVDGVSESTCSRSSWTSLPTPSRCRNPKPRRPVRRNPTRRAVSLTRCSEACRKA